MDLAARRRSATRVNVDNALAAATVVIAAIIICLVLTPVGVWHHPAVDAKYRGFDPNLIFVSETGPASKAGQVRVSTESIEVTALPSSHPTVHLLTTPLSFSTSLDVEIASSSIGTVPLRIGVWSAESGSGYFVVFDSSGFIRQQTISGGVPEQDLMGGTATEWPVLGVYHTGETYRLSLNMDQPHRTISTKVLGPDVPAASSLIDASVEPDLFKAFRYALTVSSWAESGSARAIVRNFSLTLPGQSTASAEEVVKIDDPHARMLVLSLLLLSVVVGVVAATRFVRLRGSEIRIRLAGLSRAARRSSIYLALGVAICIIYIIANVPLFGLASPHYDVFSAKVWSYVAFKDGLADLYYRTLLVTAAAASSGIPLHEAGFPYGITKAYYYFVIGWTYHIAVPGGGVSDFSFEGLLKGFNVLLGFIDGLIAFLILRRLTDLPTAAISAIVLVLNPALIFVMSVWGSTETVSIFFVLASILLAERDRPLGAWLMLAAAAYTRPQMFVLAFLLGAVYVRKFSVSRNLRAIPWAVIVLFLFMSPFALAISPSMPVDYVARTLIFHFGNGQADLPYLGTSPGYYSFWTLPPLLLTGQHGLDRMWFPSTQHLIGPWTYGQVGAGLSVAMLLVIGTVLLISKRASGTPGGYLPVVAFAMLLWLMVTPGLISRYFVYGIVAVILCRRWFRAPSYLLTVGLLTLITVVTAYGHIALDFLGASGAVNVMSPTNNALSHFVFSLFASDWFISLGAAINITILCILAIKAWQAVRPVNGRRREAAVVAP
ncbi:MAG: hypothetical protein E6I60_08115 [Chloroflexi bacterium]|nr:MAG: hypothetical protein E6I60_08115 [Chloroflexota bacterium]